MLEKVLKEHMLIVWYGEGRGGGGVGGAAVVAASFSVSGAFPWLSSSSCQSDQADLSNLVTEAPLLHSFLPQMS